MGEAEGRGGNESRPGRRLRRVAGREIAFDDEGFFSDYDDWTDDAAVALAVESGIAVLGDDHWRVIRFLRGFYAYHGRAPLNQQLRQGIGMSLLTLNDLFPDGLRNGARRIAGLPNPKSCR